LFSPTLRNLDSDWHAGTASRVAILLFFNGLFDGHFNRLYLVVDSADQVVSILLVDEAPRAKFDQAQQNGFHTHNFIENQSKALRSLIVEHCVTRGKEKTLVVDSRLIAPQENSAADNGNTLLEESRWFVPLPLVNVVLACAEGR
jgi:hypothetical protein